MPQVGLRPPGRRSQVEYLTRNMFRVWQVWTLGAWVQILALPLTGAMNSACFVSQPPQRQLASEDGRFINSGWLGVGRCWFTVGSAAFGPVAGQCVMWETHYRGRSVLQRSKKQERKKRLRGKTLAYPASNPGPCITLLSS